MTSRHFIELAALHTDRQQLTSRIKYAFDFNFGWQRRNIMAIYDFYNWLVIKKAIEEGFDEPSDPTDKFKFNNADDRSNVADDYEKTQKEVTKVVMTKYHSQFMRFLRQLSEEHSDGELQGLIRKLETDKSSGYTKSWKPNHPSNKDDVVPPEADRGIDPNSVD